VELYATPYDPNGGVYLSGFVNSVKGSMEVFQGMYNTEGLECITDAKAWYIDKHLGTSVMYSGQSFSDNVVVVNYVNMEAVCNELDSVMLLIGARQGIDLAKSRFGFPAGCNWGIKSNKSEMLLAVHI